MALVGSILTVPAVAQTTATDLGNGTPAMRTPTGATTARSIADAAADVLQGADNGMKCDGVTDDGPALQLLVNRVSASTSPDIQLPYGKCLIDTAVVIKAAPVHLRGHSWSEVTSTGTTLHTTNPAIIPLSITPLVPNGVYRTNGSSIEGIAISQQQPLPVTAAAAITAGSSQIVTAVPAKVGSAVIGSGIPHEAFVTALGRSGPNYTLTLNVAATATVPSASVTTWSPTVYKPFIFARDTASLKFKDIYGYGIYDGISLYNVGRDEITNIYGQFFHNVVTTDAGYDLAHFNDFHIWPFWNTEIGRDFVYGQGASFDVVMAWQEANMDAIVMGRQDGATLHDMFFFMTNGAITFKPLDNKGSATNIMVDQVQCDSTVHCIKNVSGQEVTLFLGALNSFGQRGASSATVYPGANAIFADGNSSFVINGGDIKMGLPDKNVVQLDSATRSSTIDLDSLSTYLMAGNVGSSIIRSAGKNQGVAPDMISVANPLNIAVRSGSGKYMAGVNWASTNAMVRIPGLDYQLIEAPAASGFNGHSYAIENARPKLTFEADDGKPIADITILMPTATYDGVELVVISNVAVHAVTFRDPNGRPIIGAPASLTPYLAARFKLMDTGSQTVWFRQ